MIKRYLKRPLVAAVILCFVFGFAVGAFHVPLIIAVGLGFTVAAVSALFSGRSALTVPSDRRGRVRKKNLKRSSGEIRAEEASSRLIETAPSRVAATRDLRVEPKEVVKFESSLAPSVDVPVVESKMDRVENVEPIERPLPPRDVLAHTWLQFIPEEPKARSHSDLNNLFDLISKLEEPAGRRLIISQFKTEARLIDSLDTVLEDGRAYSEAILKNVAPQTDLIPFGELSLRSSTEPFLSYLIQNYSQVVLHAPSSERQKWMSAFLPSSEAGAPRDVAL